MVGFAGSVLGAALAYSLLFVFQRIYKNADGTLLFSTQLAPELLLTACGTAIAVGLLAAAVPARRAAHMDPVQAIRS